MISTHKKINDFIINERNYAMKKSIKCLSAVLMTSVLAVSAGAMAMPAFAGTINVTPAADSTNTYKAYQLISGTYTAENTLTNITFGANLPVASDKLTSGLVTALKSADSTAFASLTVDTTPTELATMIGSLSTVAQQEKFARVIGKYVTGDGITVSTTDTTVNDGYYIVKEEGTVAPKSFNLLKVAGAISLTAKENTPSSGKTVADTNDSTGAADTHTKTADYDIGDDIPYVLTFTLPSDYARYEKYPVTFWDDMCAGLSLNADSVKIWYGDTDTSTGGTKIEFATKSSTETGGTFENPTGGTIYKYEIADLKTTAPSMAANQTITIRYTAKLTGDAVVIGAPGNPNSYKVTYANDPNWTAIPGPGETTPPTTPPTGDTPESKNVVFTYQLTVNKTDDDGNALNGAKFTLYKWTDTANAADIDATTGWDQVQQIQLADAAQFNFKGLDDGTYKLVETTPPTNYNGIDPILFTITAEHSDATYGLGTVSQTGITNASITNGVISVAIKNNKGVTLPSTGGMGTTIFYIVGSLMITGALVLLIVRKRMNIKEK